ncbi:MAG: DUF5316 domain-containing protein [Sporolactobacillus sp.]
MKKRGFLFIGLILGLLLFILGINIRQHELIANLSGIFGIACLLLSGTTVGAFISGDQVRANFFSESKKSRQERIDLGIKSAFLGLPFIAVSIGIYLIFGI